MPADNLPGTPTLQSVPETWHRSTAQVPTCQQDQRRGYARAVLRALAQTHGRPGEQWAGTGGCSRGRVDLIRTVTYRYR